MLETIDLLRERVPAVLEAASRSEIAPVDQKRNAGRGSALVRRPLSRLALAAAACLAIVVAWWLIPGGQPAAQAFHMFADALVDAKSAEFQLEVDIPGHGIQRFQSYYLAPGKMRSEMTGVVSIADLKTGKTVNLLPEQKTALVITVKNVPSEPGRPRFDDFFEELRDLLSKRRDTLDEGVKQLGEKEIDGRRAIGFRCESPVATVILWGDPATGLPLLVESVSTGIPHIEVKLSRFFFNGHLEPALFDTTPPADYIVREFDLDFSKPTETALIDGLRMSADLNDGVFADNLDSANDYALLLKSPKNAIGDKQDKLRDMAPELMTIGRGMTFAAELPESADAHYAGKGVKHGEPNRPIFWYKPEGAKAYRVIYADLSVKEAESAPAVVTGPLLAAGQSTFQAFNMFAEAIVDAKSATFDMEASIAGQGKQVGKSYYLAPGKMRTTAKGMVMVFDTKAGKMVFLSDKQKTAVVTNIKNRPHEPGKPQMDDVFEQMRDLLSKSRDAKEDEFKQLGEKEIDGRRAIGFSYATAAQSLTLWGDPTTGLPVLVEMVFSGKPRSEVTMSHFELNEKLDPALFDTTPPAHYKVQTFDFDASKPTEATLIEALRLAADANDGVFINNLDMAGMMAVMIKYAEKSVRDRKDKSQGVPPEVMDTAMTIGRGISFALEELPETADAHYAGKGVKLDESDRPIFWYKPEGSKTYRVIYADLSVKEAEAAPEIAGAMRLEKTRPAEKEEK